MNEEQMDKEQMNEEPVLEEFSYEIKIPEERVAVLIGKEGATKNQIEKNSGSKLDISKEGNVTVIGNDALNLFSTKEIVRAIGRGFNPKIALLLLKQDYILEIISLKDIIGKSKSSMERLKGRIIGKAGKSRDNIEQLTHCYISVYGKTIGIIGDAMDVTLCHQAVSMLLKGAMHKTVFKFLEKRIKDNELANGILQKF